MDSKKLNIIKQNLLITQFIFIIEGYIEYILLNKIKKNTKMNKTSIIDLMEKHMIKFFLINKNNKKNINNIIKILELIIKNVIPLITLYYEKKELKNVQEQNELI